MILLITKVHVYILVTGSSSNFYLCCRLCSTTPGCSVRTYQCCDCPYQYGCRPKHSSSYWRHCSTSGMSWWACYFGELSIINAWVHLQALACAHFYKGGEPSVRKCKLHYVECVGSHPSGSCLPKWACTGMLLTSEMYICSRSMCKCSEWGVGAVNIVLTVGGEFTPPFRPILSFLSPAV